MELHKRKRERLNLENIVKNYPVGIYWERNKKLYVPENVIKRMITSVCMTQEFTDLC